MLMGLKIHIQSLKCIKSLLVPFNVFGTLLLHNVSIHYVISCGVSFLLFLLQKIDSQSHRIRSTSWNIFLFSLDAVTGRFSLRGKRCHIMHCCSCFTNCVSRNNINPPPSVYLKCCIPPSRPLCVNGITPQLLSNIVIISAHLWLPFIW